MTAERHPALVRLLRALLRLYPRATRDRFGDGLVYGELRDFEAARHRTLPMRLLFVVRMATQHLWHGLAARLRRATPAPDRGVTGAGRRLRLSSLQDWRAAWRAARTAPLTSVLVIGSLALGIGATTAIFSVVQAVLLDPLPYGEPDRLVMVSSHAPSQGRPVGPVSTADFLDLRERASTFERLEAFQANIVPTTLTIDGEPVPAQRVVVTPGMFDLLGRTAAIGRVFDADADRDAIVISHGCWQRVFGGDPGVIGRRVGNGQLTLTVTGVMPPDFAFPYPSMLLGPVSFTANTDVDFWLPVEPATGTPRAARSLGVVGRLAGGVTPEQAHAEAMAVAAALERSHPDSNAGVGLTVSRLHDQAVGGSRPVLLLLFAGVVAVLLIGCANTAGLLLARGSARRHEMALRRALGATRGRLIRQVLHESVLLALVGAGLGAALALPATGLLVSMAPADVPRLDAVDIDAGVLTFAVLVAVLTGLATGLVPALAAARGAALTGLSSSDRTATSGPARQSARSVLVVVEVALVVVVVVATGLVVRSFFHVLRVDTGFRTDRLLTLQIAVPGDAARSPDGRRAFYARFFETLTAVPGVVRAGGTTRLPLGGADSTTEIAREGSGLPIAEWPVVDLRRALFDYFATMEMPILRGRGFDERDGPDDPPVVVINQTLSRLLYGGASPVGERVQLGPNAGIASAAIIGVVADIRHRDLETAPSPEVYIRAAQNPPVAPIIAIRTAGDPGTTAPAIRRALEQAFPDVPIGSLRAMQALRADAAAPRLFVTVLVSVFGSLGLTLAVAGVYGLTSLVAAARLRELAIRQALGAARPTVVWLVVGHSARVATLGLAIGLGIALLATPALGASLFGVRPADPATYALVAGVLLATTLIAAAVPAIRASRVDPVAILRRDG